ncbi:MAG: NADH:flavin oxidoreductase, partial [[Mycobacterium] stephanolepidis]
DARQFREELDMPLILLGGIAGGDTMDLAMAEGFDFVAMGRALLADPDLVNQVAADRATHSRCTHCNQCMATIFSRTHCVLT